jgi:hypothetical protein
MSASDISMARHSFQPQYMLAIAGIAQNVATGLTFGSIGLLIEPLAAELQGSRSTISLSISLIILMMGLLGPLVGRWVDRWSLRGTMLIGALLGAAGFYLASRATSTAGFLVCYGLLVGIGFAMIGVLPANKIVTLWFPRSVGRASAIVNMPLAIALLPPLFATMLRDTGWRHLLEIFALVYVALFGLLLLLRVPVETAADTVVADGAAAPDIAPFRSRIFWLLAMIIGLLTTSGIVATTHVVPFAQSVALRFRNIFRAGRRVLRLALRSHHAAVRLVDDRRVSHRSLARIGATTRFPDHRGARCRTGAGRRRVDADARGAAGAYFFRTAIRPRIWPDELRHTTVHVCRCAVDRPGLRLVGQLSRSVLPANADMWGGGGAANADAVRAAQITDGMTRDVLDET